MKIPSIWIHHSIKADKSEEDVPEHQSCFMILLQQFVQKTYYNSFSNSGVEK